MITLLNQDCMTYMAGMEANSVDAIITDPPYFRVKGEAWDNQWETSAKFIEWIGQLCGEFERILKPNGSLYFFASPQMAARVEVKIAERFNVLNSITWRKGTAGSREISRGNAAEKEALRSYFATSEKIIFAEHYGADNIAKGEAGYEAKCDELRGFVFEPLRAYLDGERVSAGFDRQMCDKVCGNQMSGHYFSRVQWTLPTESNYNKLREAFNSANGGDYLRREYEDLRRPFSVTAKDQWSDVWEFDPVGAYQGKHPCEKPIPLLSHILNASTKPGAVVFDPFAGSGSMGHACHNLGRNFIGTELCPTNYAKAKLRLDAIQAQAGLFDLDDYDRVTRDYQESLL